MGGDVDRRVVQESVSTTALLQPSLAALQMDDEGTLLLLPLAFDPLLDDCKMLLIPFMLKKEVMRRDGNWTSV
jgi:hypothetical protein